MTPEQLAKLNEANEVIAKTLAAHLCPWHYVPHEAQVYLVDAAGGVIELFEMLDFVVAQSTVIALTAAAAPQKAAETT